MEYVDFKIQSRQHLTESDLDAIRGLERICNEHEGLIMKLNWDMLSERHPGVTNDFLCFDSKGQLAGYLALYSFGRPEAEVSGMVHPLYRRSGIFTRLLAKASDECRQRGNVESLLFICDRKSSSGMAFIKSADAVFDHSENKMELPGNMAPIEQQGPITLRKAAAKDIGTLAKLDAICFGRTEDEARTYYIENLISSDELYISVLDGNDIGMLKLCREDRDILVYGFGILPEYRGRGYGRLTLGRAINTALERKPDHVALEVDCVNDTALSLYKSCGFKTTVTYDYYRIKVDGF